MARSHYLSQFWPRSMSPYGITRPQWVNVLNMNGHHTCELFWFLYLTHWGLVTRICVGKLTIIVSDNGLSPEWRQAIIWTNAGILLIGTWGTNFSEILIEIHPFSFKKMHLKMSSGKWRPFCLGLNVLNRKVTTVKEGCQTGNLQCLHKDQVVSMTTSCFSTLCYNTNIDRTGLIHILMF